MDRHVRRCASRNLHNDRIADLRYEHEPCANVQFRVWRTHLDVTLDLFHRAAIGNVAGCGSLPANKTRQRSRMRKAASP